MASKKVLETKHLYEKHRHKLGILIFDQAEIKQECWSGLQWLSKAAKPETNRRDVAYNSM